MLKNNLNLNGVFLILYLLLCGVVKAKEVPKLEPKWIKTFGGSNTDWTNALQVLPNETLQYTNFLGSTL
ncbi:hypothetical protein J7K43_06900 [Candidatus Calescamantes bacterium]|nr:hypothetical protein [Candidatus Calescamantes bacterium]